MDVQQSQTLLTSTDEEVECDERLFSRKLTNYGKRVDVSSRWNFRRIIPFALHIGLFIIYGTFILITNSRQPHQAKAWPGIEFSCQFYYGIGLIQSRCIWWFTIPRNYRKNFPSHRIRGASYGGKRESMGWIIKRWSDPRLRSFIH